MAGLDQMMVGVDPDLYRKQLAQHLVQSGLDASPIRSPWQGAARMAQALLGGMQLNQLQGDPVAEANMERQKNNLPPLEGSGSPSIFGGIGSRLGSLLSGGMSETPQQQPDTSVASQQPQPDKSLPRGLRNNNPGNLEASPWTQKQPGFVGPEPAGRFAQFKDLKSGFDAMDSLLHNYGKQGVDSLNGVISKWAPSSDGNNVSAYAQFVANKTGIDPNSKINLTDPSVRETIVPAMALYENGKLPQQPSTNAVAFNGPVNAMPIPSAIAGQGQAQPIPAATGQPPAQQVQAQQPITTPPAAPTRNLAQWTPEALQRLDQLTRQKALGGTIGQKASAEIVALRNKIENPTEHWEPVYVQGRLVGQRSSLTGKTEQTPEAQPSQVIADEMLANPKKYGFTGPDDPFLLNTVATRLSGAQNALPLPPEQQGRISFANKAAEANVKTFSEILNAAGPANEMKGNIAALQALGQDARTGPLADFRTKLQAIAEQMGVDTSGIADVGSAQGMKALVGKMALTLRPPGVQIRSNYEFRALMDQVPSLDTTPQGRTMIAMIMDRVSDRRLQEAQIANLALAGHIAPEAAHKQIADLGPVFTPDMMEQIKAEAKRASGFQGGTPQKSQQTVPQQGGVVDYRSYFGQQ